MRTAAADCSPYHARPPSKKLRALSSTRAPVKFATENAKANGIANATFLAADAAQIFAGLSFPPSDTAIVIDPPRKGCDELFLGQLFSFGPRAVVYVSCDPATQMRDLKGFLAAGYQLTSSTAIRPLPANASFECVITFFGEKITPRVRETPEGRAGYP